MTTMNADKDDAVHQVPKANLLGVLCSTGDAKDTLIRQWNFPDKYLGREKLLRKQHNKIYQDHLDECLRKYGIKEVEIPKFVRDRAPDEVMEFIKDMVKPDESVEWTGFRVLGTVNTGNGHCIFTLELFALGEGSTTNVYSDEKAPNVIPGYGKGVINFRHSIR